MLINTIYFIIFFRFSKLQDKSVYTFNILNTNSSVLRQLNSFMKTNIIKLNNLKQFKNKIKLYYKTIKNKKNIRLVQNKMLHSKMCSCLIFTKLTFNKYIIRKLLYMIVIHYQNKMLCSKKICSCLNFTNLLKIPNLYTLLRTQSKV